MSVWESDRTSDILSKLSNLADRLDVYNKKNYSNYYFQEQLARYYYTLQLILENIDKGKTLDIGSYPGHLMKVLIDAGYDIYGVDIRPERMADELSDCKDRTIAWDIENAKFSDSLDNEYDNILMFEVIEHLHVNPLNLLSELSRITKMGGGILISTPNLFQMSNRIKFMMGRYVFEHPLSVFESLDKHGSRGHQRLYSINELTDLLEVYGFKIEKIWCIDNKPPYLSKSKYRSEIPEEHLNKLYKKFWSDSRSFKGRIRRNIEIHANSIFKGFYENIYIHATKCGSFSEDLFYERIKKADPWIDFGKYKLDV